EAGCEGQVGGEAELPAIEDLAYPLNLNRIKVVSPKLGLAQVEAAGQPRAVLAGLFDQLTPQRGEGWPLGQAREVIPGHPHVPWPASDREKRFRRLGQTERLSGFGEDVSGNLTHHVLVGRRDDRLVPGGGFRSEERRE